MISTSALPLPSVEIPFIPIQHPLIDIRQFPAVHAGLYLLTDELHCDYIPIEKDDLHWYALPKEFVVVHAPQYGSSNIKNWDINNWKALCKSINLPRKEFELLFLLASKPGKVFKREKIME